MTGGRSAARLGAGAALGLVVLVLVPYALTDGRAVAVYYGGLVGPPLAGLFAAVAVIAFAGAVAERTDAPTAAGVVVVLGVLTFALVVSWALGVSPALVGGMTTLAAFEYHRWALVAGAAGLLAAAAWFARAVL